MNVNSAHKCLFKADTISIALGVRPVQIWQQGHQSNFCHIVLKFWLTLGRPLHYFLVLLWLTLNILVLLWMSLNSTLWHNFGEYQIGVIFMRVVAKHYFATLLMTRPMECFSHVIMYKLLWRRRIFIIYCSVI